MLVLRDETERPEAVQAGTVQLVGWNRDAIVRAVSDLWERPEVYARFARALNPYGDGRAADRIAAVLRDDTGCNAGKRTSRSHPGPRPSRRRQPGQLIGRVEHAAFRRCGVIRGTADGGGPSDDILVRGRPGALILGLAFSLPPSCRFAFVLFPDGGRSRAFGQELRAHRLETITLGRDTPHLWAMARELAGRIRELGVGVLCYHGYKADLVGLLAAGG